MFFSLYVKAGRRLRRGCGGRGACWSKTSCWSKTDGHAGGQFHPRRPGAHGMAGRRPLIDRCARPARPSPPLTTKSASTLNLIERPLHLPRSSLLLAPLALAQGVFLGVHGVKPPLSVLVAGARRWEAGSCRGMQALAGGGRRRSLPCLWETRLAQPRVFGTSSTHGNGNRLRTSI